MKLTQVEKGLVEPRGERLQIMLTKEELIALDTWRFDRRMPSRAAAIRELLRRGLDAEGFAVTDGSTKSGDFSVLSPDNPSDAVGDGKPRNRARTAGG